MILANFRHPAACLVAVGESGLYAGGVLGVERVLAVRLLLDARRRATRVQLHAAELILGCFYLVVNEDFGELELRTSPNFRTSFFF